MVNPYADRLTFLSDKTRTRRDHRKYLALIRSIALLHQHQREIHRVVHQGKRVEYIEVTLEDIETANRLAHEVLGRTLDELPPQTRRLLHLIHELVTERCVALEMRRCDYRFSRRDVREATGWTDFQVKSHMKKLEAMEYVLVHRGGRGQSFVYELLYNGEGQDTQLFLMGLIETATLKRGYDAKKEHVKPEKEGASSPQRAPKSAPSSYAQNRRKPSNDATSGDPEDEIPENALKISPSAFFSSSGLRVRNNWPNASLGISRYSCLGN